MTLASVAPVVHAQGLTLADTLQLALARNPNIQVQRTEVDAALGRQQRARGQFDWIVSSRIEYGRTITPLSDSTRITTQSGLIDQTRLYSSAYQVGVSKQLRNGIIVSANAEAAGTEDATESPAPYQQNLARLSVSLTIPLLQGRGRAVTAAERAADLTAQARHYDLLDSMSRTLYSTLVAYWNYLARVEIEKVAISSEERNTSLLASTQKLVDAAEKPAADLVLLKADHADKVAAREAAALARGEAKRELGRLLGLDANAIEALPEPAEPFPALAALPATVGSGGAMLRREALERRPDMRALALQLEAAQYDMAAARDLLKPRLDVSMGIEQAKASEGNGRYRLFNQPGRYQSTPSVFARLNFDFPVVNNQAKGAVRESAAALSQVRILQSDLANSVTTGVDSALQALFSNAAQLNVGRTGLALYETAVNQEILKQRNGISTLIDVINTEARFVNARISFLQAQLAYVTAIARLRLETGTLAPVPDASGSFLLDPNALRGFGPLATKLLGSAPPVRTEDHEK